MNAASTQKRAYDAVLLDMDGTLIDHFHALYRCYKHVAEKIGHPAPSPEAVKRGVGGSMPITIRKFFPEETLDEAMRLWRDYFDRIHLEDAVPLPGAIPLLRNLQSQGIKAGVFTNKIGRHTRNLCDSLGFTPYLAFALGAEDTPYRKPDPEFSKIALERLGLSAERVAMIGDSPFDIEAARSVGMASLCVPTGSHTRSELEADGAHRVFESLQQISDEVFI